MPVFIYERDAFRKMIAVEGPEYPRNQRFFGSVSFGAAKREWDKFFRDNEELRNSRPEFVIGITAQDVGIIYGLGGWNRYVVLNSGEIMLTGDMSSPRCRKCIEPARRIGFRIFPIDIKR